MNKEDVEDRVEKKIKSVCLEEKDGMNRARWRVGVGKRGFCIKVRAQISTRLTVPSSTTG